MGSAFDAFRYDGLRALVVGGASGMGAAVANLAADAGAKVTIMDIVPVDHPDRQSIRLNLSERSSID